MKSQIEVIERKNRKMMAQIYDRIAKKSREMYAQLSLLRRSDISTTVTEMASSVVRPQHSQLERSLMAMVYELQSLSAALRMHDAFAREARGVLPLLEELGDKSVVRYRDRYERLMHKYEELGRPKRLRTIEDQSYLRDIRQFSQDLLAYVEHRYPTKLGGGAP